MCLSSYGVSVLFDQTSNSGKLSSNLCWVILSWSACIRAKKVSSSFSLNWMLSQNSNSELIVDQHISNVAFWSGVKSELTGGLLSAATVLSRRKKLRGCTEERKEAITNAPPQRAGDHRLFFRFVRPSSRKLDSPVIVQRGDMGAAPRCALPFSRLNILGISQALWLSDHRLLNLTYAETSAYNGCCPIASVTRKYLQDVFHSEPPDLQASGRVFCSNSSQAVPVRNAHQQGL